MRYARAIDSYISYCFDSYEVKTIDERPNSIYWVKGQETIVEIKNSKYFWLRRDIWDSISKLFDLEYSETQSVIKEWLQLHYNFGGLTPDWIIRFEGKGLQLHYNLGD